MASKIGAIRITGRVHYMSKILDARENFAGQENCFKKFNMVEVICDGFWIVGEVK